MLGTPDLIVEILSPGYNKKEIQHKHKVYEESGVKENWILLPDEQTHLIYTLTGAGCLPTRLFTLGDIVVSCSVLGFHFHIEEVLRNLE